MEQMPIRIDTLPIDTQLQLILNDLMGIDIPARYALQFGSAVKALEGVVEQARLQGAEAPAKADKPTT